MTCDPSVTGSGGSGPVIFIPSSKLSQSADIVELETNDNLSKLFLKKNGCKIIATCLS